MYKIISLIFLLISFVSCNSGSDSSLEKKLGIEPPVVQTSDSEEGPNLSEARVLKITLAGDGDQPELNDVNLNISDSISMKAALFDLSGNYVEDVIATWVITNPLFSVNNIVLNGSLNTLTFTPSEAGVTMIRATFVGSSGTLISNSDLTGLITVINPAPPADPFEEFRVLKILKAGVGDQDEQFDHSMDIGDTLSLKAALFDTRGNFIEDVAVNWSFSNSTFDNNDRVVTSGGVNFSFTPDNSGVVMIKATYVSNNSAVIISSDFTGSINVQNPLAPQSLSDLRIFKIIKAGAGNQDQVDDEALLVGDVYPMKAALFDMIGNYIEDAPAVWTLTNTSFSSANLVTTNSGVNATFTPTRPGAVVVSANYSGNNTKVISLVDVTGVFTITNIQVPDSVLLFGGNNQSGTVNNNLVETLKIKVLDEFNQPIAGESVTWSVTQGSGSIIGTNPVFTDQDGVAEVLVKLGTQAGGGNNQYRAVITSVPSLLVDFSATATAGPQHHLTFTTQPALLFAGISFGVQPVVELRDEFDN